jgi:outer membrane protein TolC
MKWHANSSNRFICEHVLLAASTLFLLGGCAGENGPATPFIIPATPTEWHNANEARVLPSVASTAPLSIAAGDPVLMRLIERALTDGREIQHRQMLLQAATLNNAIGPNAGQVVTGIGASANLSTSLAQERGTQSVQVDGYSLPVSNPNRISQSYALSVGASYEVDLWHRLSLGRGLEGKQREIIEADIKVARLIAANDVAVAYCSIAALDARMSLDAKRIANTQAAIAQAEAQQREGLIIKSDLSRVRTNLADLVRSQRARGFERASHQYAIALLIGTSPVTFTLAHAQLPDIVDSVVSPLLPVDILMKRPDVQIARAELDSRALEMQIDKAALLPNLVFNLSAGNNVAKLLDLGIHPITLGLSAVAPIFDWKHVSVKGQTVRLAYDDAAKAFQSTYFQALAEIEVAFATLMVRHDMQMRAESELVAATERLRLATLSYEVLGTSRQLLREREDETVDASITLIDARLAAIVARLALCRVLASDAML